MMSAPLPQESDKCGVSKVKTNIETSYVLKYPTPPFCLPPDPQPSNISHEEINTEVTNNEPEKTRTKRAFKRHNRRWKNFKKWA